MRIKHALVVLLAFFAVACGPMAGITPVPSAEFARREAYDWRTTLGTWTYVQIPVGFYCRDLDTGYYAEGPVARFMGQRVECGKTGYVPRDYINRYPPPELYPEGRYPGEFSGRRRR